MLEVHVSSATRDFAVGLLFPMLWGDRASVARAVGIMLFLAKPSRCQSFKDQQQTDPNSLA